MAIETPTASQRAHLLMKDLNSAISAARAGDWVREEAMTDHIRDISYSVTPRYAGYQLRSACGAIDAAQRSQDLEGSLAFAEHEVEKLRDIFLRSGCASDAA
ncbi:hypothetical protein [Celeribacter litoreus]|uniref:hypothetical protein n=1 Tax=Celeribacter litoreus TaxID=2876714 RepID=UPI001CCF6F34|nr:hypothetical protein [Celeribacter litoreus]MCA0043565.1 hypothetical protein [Celeribacter litoreus]